MPIAARKGHCALGIDGARHLETARQTVHAGGCLPGEDHRRAVDVALEGHTDGPISSFTPPLLRTTDS